jgi:hypothetical protein
MPSKVEDDYWGDEKLLGCVPLPPRDQEQEIFFLIHHSRESYGKDHREIGVRLRQAGERDYLHVRAITYVPRIVLTIAPIPPVPTEVGEEIGEVMASRREGSDQRVIAGLQAWYYRSERILMLWEVDIFGEYREADPTRDFLLGVMWQAFERELLARAPAAEWIVTPAWDPKYPNEEWRAFLASQEYTPHIENTFIKRLVDDRKPST